MMTIALAAALVATSCASGTDSERRPEKGPDTVVAGPPERDGAAAPAAVSSGLDEVQVSGADRGEVVKLRFDYPEAGSAIVKESGQEIGPHQVDLIMKSRVVFQQADDELRISTRYVGMLPPDDSAESRETMQLIDQYYSQDLAKMKTTLVVDDTGGIVRTEGVEEAWRIAKEVNHPAGAQMNDFIQRLIAATADAGNVGQQPIQQWIFHVQLWDGQELKIGEKKVGHFESYFPTAMRGFHRATVDVEYMAAGRERCSPSDTKRSCVRLRLSATADPQQLTLGARRFETKVRSALPEQFKQAMPLSKSLSTHLDVELIVEPDTLLPYRVTWRLQDRLVLADGQVDDEDVRRVIVYEYK